MIYFIAEDSNSAHTFWIHVLDLFAGSYMEITTDIQGREAYGNCSLESKVDNALTRTQPGDSIFIAFDNIGSPLSPGRNTAFDSGDFIMNTDAKCRMNGVNLYITNYYCFEEVYLTYEELENMCLKDGDAGLANAIRYVREHIDTGADYFDKNNPYMKRMISVVKDAGKNKEHFAGALLYQATKSIAHGYFTINKEKNGFGRCWTASCEDIRNNKKGIKTVSVLNYFCNNCIYALKGADAKEKLLDIDKRSILRYAELTFEQIQDI